MIETQQAEVTARKETDESSTPVFTDGQGRRPFCEHRLSGSNCGALAPQDVRNKGIGCRNDAGWARSFRSNCPQLKYSHRPGSVQQGESAVLNLAEFLLQLGN